MGEFSPPFFWAPFFLFFLIPQILKWYLTSLTLLQKFTPPFQNPGSAFVYYSGTIKNNHCTCVVLSLSAQTLTGSFHWHFIAKREEHMVPNDVPQNCCDCQGIKACEKRSVFILTGHWSHCDQEGSAPRARPPLHFTEAESCVFPRIWVHGVQFLLVGQTCVRARLPSNATKKPLLKLRS